MRLFLSRYFWSVAFFLSICAINAPFSQAQVFINEVMADNKNTITDPDKGNNGDWIELYNTGSSSIDLSGFGLSDDTASLFKWVFPSGIRIASKAYLLIWADNDNVGLHTNFRLSKSGEILLLTNKAGEVLDSIAFGEQIEDVSYGRRNDGSSEWVFFSSPTPGQSNSTGTANLMAAPARFSLNSGFYSGSQSLVLSKQSPTAKIYYTRDGSDPTESSSEYTGPLVIDKTSVVRAIQIETGFLNSVAVTKTYFIDENTTLPVFSIVTDPYNLWDLDSGIYVEGRNYVWGWGTGNFWQDWEKPCFVEFWESDRDQKISQGAGLKINGALTRTASQKSLRIFARSEYGKNKFSYRFFKDKDINSFNELVLRSSGNDWARTMMAGGLMATIVSQQMDIDYDAYRPAILFLNGEYWGIHNIREKVGNDFIEENHGFSKDNLDLLSQIDGVYLGDRLDYSALLNYVKQNSMADPAKYAYVKTKIDIQEYINYFVTQIFYANEDWPAGNIKYWRPRIEKGKWRWVLFDTDLAFQNFSVNTLEWVTDPDPTYPGANDLFRNLMDSEEFRQKVLDTYQYRMATTFKEDRILGIIDSLQHLIEGEMPRHIARWYGQHGWTFEYNGELIETPWLESMDVWKANVESLRRFTRNRATSLNNYFQNYYGLGDPFELLITQDPPGSGKVFINENMGVEGDLTYTVFKNQDISFQALNNLDTEFSNWKIASNFYAVGDVVPLVPANSVWKYLDTGVYPDSDWKAEDFNDNNWKSGAGILGYNDLNAQTLLDFGSDPNNKPISCLFRLKFEIQSPSDWNNLVIRILRDDGAVVYLNGQEVVRSNMPDQSNFNTLATIGVDGADESTYFNFSIPKEVLVSGTNILAVEVHQVTANSSDLSFDLGLTAKVVNSSSSITTSTASVLENTFTGRSLLTAVFNDRALPLEVRINEVMPINSGFYITESGKSPDWIELFNPNDQAVDVGGLYITDNLLNPDKWQISTDQPFKTLIPPKGFLILLADQRVVLGPDHIDMQLSGTGEEVAIYLKRNDEFQLIDSLFFPTMVANSSFGRYPDGADDWNFFPYSATPGASNKTLDQEVPDVPLYVFPNFPNPFSESTVVSYYLKEPAPASVIIRDMQGKQIAILAEGDHSAGIHFLEWKGTDQNNRAVGSGIYFITVRSTFYSYTLRTIRLIQ